MQVTQVSAFLENRPGRLLHLMNILAGAQINLIAHEIVDASDFGIVHMLVDSPQRAVDAIRNAGLACSATTVLQVTVPDEPGAFVERILKPLADARINIEYSYVCGVSPSGEIRIVLKVDDIARGEKVLKEYYARA